MLKPEDRDEVLAHVRALPGWLFGSEAAFLYDAARSVTGRGAIVELGSWQGKSTIALAGGAISSGTATRVYAVDTFRGSEEHQTAGPVDNLVTFQQNLAAAGVSDRVQIINATTLDAIRHFSDPIELLFIDADHSYSGTRADFDAWVPRVIPGGLVAMHDTAYWSGPRRVVRERVYGRMSCVKVTRTITSFRHSPASTVDRLSWPAAFLHSRMIGLVQMASHLRNGGGLYWTLGS